MSVKPHQHTHLANGIRRIKQAIKNCDLPVSEVGMMFKSETINSESIDFEVNIYRKIGDKYIKERMIGVSQ